MSYEDMVKPWDIRTIPRLPILVQFKNEPVYLLVVGKSLFGVTVGSGMKLSYYDLLRDYSWVVDQVNNITDRCGVVPKLE